MKYLITGGTGSLGRALTKRLTADGNEVVIYSRDEGKHAKHFSAMKRVKCVIGDVRDFNRLDEIMAFHRPTVVIHAAALKRIDDMEANPTECWKTNVIGSENVARAAIKNGVQTCMLVSTDKACYPANVYGASKFVAERTFTHLNDTAARFKPTKLASVRYGNVIASRGSFIPMWKDKLHNGETIPITDPNCSRFLFTLEDAVSFVLTATEFAHGGEVFIPYLKPYNIVDVLNCLIELEGVECSRIEETGVRPGEKLHEDMLAITELDNAWAFADDNLVAVLPPGVTVWDYNCYYTRYNGGPMNTSQNINKNMDELKALIKRGLSESN